MQSSAVSLLGIAVLFDFRRRVSRNAKFHRLIVHAFVDDATFGDGNADIFAWRGQIDS